MKKVFYILMCVTLALPMVSCGNKSSNTSTSCIEEIRALGFPTGEIYEWIWKALEQKNCELVKVTSVKANGDFCLKLYMDVLKYRTFRDTNGEPHKAVMTLHFDVYDGYITDGEFKILD